MNNRVAYNQWSDNYDSVINKTRDLEGIALRSTLLPYSLKNVLEIGCGTGKNTVWFAENANEITAVDFSEKMLNKATEKIQSNKVKFFRKDITLPWGFSETSFDIVTVSLALEHIENLNFIFEQAAKVLKINGLFYLGELHPFKQYLGSKARFEMASGIFELECFVHHISDYHTAAKQNGFSCEELKEWFDEGETVPRILTMLFKKSN
jgi:ubiquinone/menaquinone biosynthesis C-methylase UbiE